MATGAASGAFPRPPACGSFPIVEKRQLAGLVLAALGIAFAAVNLDEVDVNWVLGTWETPLIIVIALSMVLGAGLGFLASRRRG
jgi:uncharacterized integral membrane protein